MRARPDWFWEVARAAAEYAQARAWNVEYDLFRKRSRLYCALAVARMQRAIRQGGCWCGMPDCGRPKGEWA